MSFLSFVDKFIPLENMPDWAVRLYTASMRVYKKFFRKPYRRLARRRKNAKAGNRRYASWWEWKLRKRKNAFFSYTIISPVYNMEKYLDTYFTSIVRQSVSFEKHIQLILVDDGSTDASATIIKRWQKKYPKNIRYMHQANQGPNSARNAGIPYAQGQWVSWIDSDDFVHPDYFYHADQCLKKYSLYNIQMLSCRQIVYSEIQDNYKDNRPFRVFFQAEETLLPHNDLKDHMHLTVNSAFFSLGEIHRQKIRFAQGEKWRTFEDAHFVLRYLQQTCNGHVLFARKPVYYYRKRADASSLLDLSWTRKDFFLDVLEYGYLGILQFYQSKTGKVPEFVQRTILYDMTWKIRGLVYAPKRASLLSPEEKEYFLSLCDKVFEYIDGKVIDGFPVGLSQFWYFFKMGTVHCFKKEEFLCKYAYIDDYDWRRGLLKIRTYGSSPAGAEGEAYWDKGASRPVYSKTMRRMFLTRTFIHERHIWLTLPVEGILSFKMGARQLELDLGGVKHKTLPSQKILEFFTRQLGSATLPPISAPWILIDRDVQADDNAEHLYRYIAANYPERKIYFALRKSSHDWERLRKEGFNLLPFGSPRFLQVLLGASKLISSHLEQYIIHYKDNILRWKHFVCLQHGVTKDDLSAWLNTKRIDMFVTSTEKEYLSIVEEGSSYCLSSKEVVNTGFARHDALLELAEKRPVREKIIVIMPTWRNYLIGESKGKSHDKELLPDFFSSEYARAWLGLLQSKRLKNILEKHGYRLQFYPHFEMQGYFQSILLPAHVEMLFCKNGGMQEVFVNASALITDYSSVAFEICFLRKPVLYYQFDEETFFSGTHSYARGYFDYRRDGFGPVCPDEHTVLDALEKLLLNGCSPSPEYRERMESAFPRRDGKNCERIYNAINDLDNPPEYLAGAVASDRPALARSRPSCFVKSRYPFRAPRKGVHALAALAGRQFHRSRRGLRVSALPLGEAPGLEAEPQNILQTSF